jgi:hypothetical protein
MYAINFSVPKFYYDFLFFYLFIVSGRFFALTCSGGILLWW